MSKRWQDWITPLLGLWLFLSPWTMQYDAQGVVAWNAYVLGAAITLLGALSVYRPQEVEAGEEVVMILLGLWLMISPHVLNFAGPTAGDMNPVAVGALVVIFATWGLLRNVGFDEWWEERHLRH